MVRWWGWGWGAQSAAVDEFSREKGDVAQCQLSWWRIDVCLGGGAQTQHHPSELISPSPYPEVSVEGGLQ